MEILKRDFRNVTRKSEFVIYCLGDIHNGAAPCRLDKLETVVAEIAGQSNAYWVGLGDYNDLINRSDPRYSPSAMADWIDLGDLTDLARAQREKFLAVIKPIAGQCLGLIEGNHETAIKRHYERDIYFEIVSGIKELGGFKSDYRLAFGYSGWLMLLFKRSAKDDRSSRVIISLHHGYTGGRLAGAKALNMQRWLWQHDCDIALMGHSHNCEVQAESVEGIDNGCNFRTSNRVGAFTGTFLDTTMPGIDTYSSSRGYPPLPVSYIKIILRPHSRSQQRIEVVPQFPI
jgi:calcineurin-like phosphoesterase family protein